MGCSINSAENELDEHFMFSSLGACFYYFCKESLSLINWFCFILQNTF